MTEIDIIYMARCIQLAALGYTNVRPNPLVGAVLVYNNVIIGEGYHKQYGQAHAEVNCLNSVAQNDIDLISHSTLYVSLEPCFHHGKTPPCVLTILDYNIKKVVIGALDCNIETHTKSIKLLREKGVEVVTHILEKECLKQNKIFFTLQEKKRPFVQLKWAQSSNAFISEKGKRTKISNEQSDIIVHQLRTEADGILIGYQTALIDNPMLNTRLIQGKSPTRIIIDWESTLPTHLNIFDQNIKTIIINSIKNEVVGNTHYVQCNKNLEEVLQSLLEHNIYSILVEGGAKTLQWFIKENIWDEAIIIQSEKIIEVGTVAPQLKMKPIQMKKIGNDEHMHYSNSEYIQ